MNFSWSKRFVADNSMFGSLITDHYLQKVSHPLRNNVFWVFFFFSSFFDDLFLILRECLLLLRKLSCFLPPSLIRRLTDRLTQITVAYLSFSNSKGKTLDEQCLKWSHRFFFQKQFSSFLTKWYILHPKVIELL